MNNQLSQVNYTKEAERKKDQNKYLYTDTDKYKGDQKLDSIVNDVRFYLVKKIVDN